MRGRVIGALCVTAIAAGGCGGSDEPAGEEQQVRAVVQEIMTATDPSICTRLATRGFLEQTTAERGSAAVRACRKDADAVGAKKLTIDRVTVDGATAVAAIRPSGGTLPFERATLALRRTDGSWKVDRLRGGTLDRAAFGRVLRTQLADEKVGASVADCAVRDLAGTSDGAIVRAYVEPDPRILVVPVAVCTIRVGLTQQQMPSSLVDCITGGARRELTSGELGRKLAADPANLALLESAAGEALGAKLAHACVRKLKLTQA
jgi:hypothetical protein